MWQESGAIETDRHGETTLEVDPGSGPESVLLERERELAELDAIVDELSDGHGRLVVIEAQAGFGKTRLLQAAREAGAEAGMQVLSARATELERDFPFALVRQLLVPPLVAMTAAERDETFAGASAAARGAVGFADDPSSPPTGDTFAVLYGLYWLTVALAEREPLLLAIDDAHWADAASLDYLGFLLPRLEELPVLLVVACRPDEADVHNGLARLTADPLARRLTPSALSRAAAVALLATELGAQPEKAFATTCHEVSGGNPFYLHELARTLSAQAVVPGAGQAELVRDLAPKRVTRTVMLRIGGLRPEARTVAHALAVLGDDSEPHLVAALAGLDADVVRGCCRRSARSRRSSTPRRRCASSTRSCAPRSTRTSPPASAPRRTRARPRCCATGTPIPEQSLHI